MPGFDEQSAKRIAKTVVWSERRMRNQRSQRGRYQRSTRYTVAIELAEELTALSGDEVDAYVRNWDPSANSGWGGYVVDCSTTLKVADRRNVGYYGVAGAQGAVEIRLCNNGRIGVLVDLCCPGDEQSECG